MPTHGKKYVEARKAIDSQKQYSVEEAVKLVKQTNYAKFDATVNIAIKTNANPKYNDQMLRATTILPHGTGKTKKVAVFVSDDKVEEAKKAGADIAGFESLLNDIKAGKIEYRLDKANIIHVPIGKASFTEDQLSDNFQAIMGAIVKAKPATVKGAYLKSIVLSSTMGPGVKVSTSKFIAG